MDTQTQSLATSASASVEEMVDSSVPIVRHKRCRRRGRKSKSVCTKSGIDSCTVDIKSLIIGCGNDTEEQLLISTHENKPSRKRKRYRKRKPHPSNSNAEKENACCQSSTISHPPLDALESCPMPQTNTPESESIIGIDSQSAILPLNTLTLEPLHLSPSSPAQSNKRKRKRRKRKPKRIKLESVSDVVPSPIRAVEPESDMPHKIESINDIENGTILAFKRLVLRETGPSVESVKAKVFMKMKSAEADNVDTLLIRPIIKKSWKKDPNFSLTLSDEPQLVKFSEIYEVTAE